MLQQNLAVRTVAVEDGTSGRRAPRPERARRPLAVALIGPGNVGSALLAQIEQASPTLRRDDGHAPQLRAVCNSQRMVWAEAALEPGTWRRELEQRGEPCDLDRLTHYLTTHDGPVAIVDTTAAPEVAARHAPWLARGFNVVTANKLACAAPQAAYERLRAAARVGGRYLYETTVGAGLPVIGILTDFVRTGDEVTRIEGVLSGTLSCLVAALMRGERFSTTIRRLSAQGCTEPDPRVDLMGLDVGRKLLILARIAGIELAPAGVEAETLVAGGDGSVAEFLERCEEFDAQIEARFAATRARGKVACYVATVTRGVGARVGLVEVDPGHAFARLRAGDNLFQITTKRYQENPLVIQGPGAGREVTAAGMFADLLRI